MKKGIQYTHYLAGDILEIINGAHLAKELMNEGSAEAAEWLRYTIERAQQLSEKLARLDIINEMKY
jgi:hypothetical protein